MKITVQLYFLKFQRGLQCILFYNAFHDFGKLLINLNTIIAETILERCVKHAFLISFFKIVDINVWHKYIFII